MIAFGFPTVSSAEDNNLLNSMRDQVESFTTTNEVNSTHLDVEKEHDLIKTETSELKKATQTLMDETIKASFQAKIEVGVNENLNVKAKLKDTEELVVDLPKVKPVVSPIKKKLNDDEGIRDTEIKDIKVDLVQEEKSHQLNIHTSKLEKSIPLPLTPKKPTFYDHPVFLGTSGPTITVPSLSTGEIRSIGSIYGFLPDQLQPITGEQGLFADKVSFYFDQWLNAPPVQPPETSFFFSIFNKK